MINNTTTTEISFWNFINEYKIEIPIIQRDYAQGRLGKENMRKNFLGDLKKTLDSDSKQKMKLDFVYGSTEQKKLTPLDGQQRLTTLWLLYWYIALRAGKLKEASETLQKFSYETRISSREFCKELCRDQFTGFDGNDIVKFITTQTWFYSAWKQDPTIQSMLRMLGGTKINDKNGDDIVDGIEELFKDCNSFDDYWDKLTTKNVIVFYHLPLDDFGLSDDLYIKMNARGKQLTNFENFKADLIGYLSNQYELENDTNKKNEWGDLLDSTEGIPIKFDTTWTNIFWNNRSDYKIDEIYFAFLNRLLLNEMICHKNGQNYLYTADNIESQNLFNLLYGNKGDDKGVIYSGLDIYKYYDKEIPIKTFQSLKRILDNYNKLENINQYFPNWTQTGFQFIPKYQDDGTITTLGQKERVVFAAVARYFEKDTFEKDSFRHWMRVVWNIVENAGVDTISAMIGAIRLIDELSEHSHDIYSYLNEDGLKIKSGTAEDQVTEEIAKIKKILKKETRSDGKSWESVIIDDAENHAFFKGAIRFLFNNENGDIDWDKFDIKLSNARKYFNKEGLAAEYRIDVTKSLVIQCDKWKEQLYDKQIFNPNASTWKWILCSSNWAKQIANILTKELYQIEPTCINDNHDVQMHITPALDKLPYKEMIEKEPDGRFHWYGQCGYYRPRGQEAIITLDWYGFSRNRILSELYNKGIIYTKQKIENYNFFNGWQINFRYKNVCFQWNTDGIIYLIENGVRKSSPQNNSYRISASDIIDSNNFINDLDKLIDQALQDSKEWINDIYKKNQLNAIIEDYSLCINVSNLKITLYVKNLTPIWGVKCEQTASMEYQDQIISKIKGLNFGNMHFYDDGYLVWSNTSYKNGERRFNELVKLLSE